MNKVITITNRNNSDFLQFEDFLDIINNLGNNYNDNLIINYSEKDNISIKRINIIRGWYGFKITIDFKVSRYSLAYEYEEKNNYNSLYNFINNIIDRYTFNKEYNKWYERLNENKGDEGIIINTFLDEKNKELETTTKLLHYNTISDSKKHDYVLRNINNIKTIFFDWDIKAIISKGYNYRNDYYTKNKIYNEELYKIYNDILYDDSLYYIYLLEKGNIKLIMYIHVKEGVDQKGNFLAMKIIVKEV